MTTPPFLRILALATCLVPLPLAACGGGDDDDDDGGGGEVDGGDDADGAPAIDGAPAGCGVSSDDFGDLGALSGGAFFFAGDPEEVYTITAGAALEEGAPADVLSVELFTGYSPFGTSEAPTPIAAGTYPISGDLLNYATCGVCLLIRTDVGDDGIGVDAYFATGGTLTITEAGDAVGETLTFALADVEFEHVTIDEETFETTPAGDGCTTAVSAATFTGTMEAPPE